MKILKGITAALLLAGLAATAIGYGLQIMLH